MCNSLDNGGNDLTKSNFNFVLPRIYNKLQFIFRENSLGFISTKEASCQVLTWKYICLKNPGLPTNKAMKGLTTSSTTWCLMVCRISKVSCHLKYMGSPVSAFSVSTVLGLVQSTKLHIPGLIVVFPKIKIEKKNI